MKTHRVRSADKKTPRKRFRSCGASPKPYSRGQLPEWRRIGCTLFTAKHSVNKTPAVLAAFSSGQERPLRERAGAFRPFHGIKFPCEFCHVGSRLPLLPPRVPAGASPWHYLPLLGLVAGTRFGVLWPGACAGLPDGNCPGGKLAEEGAIRSSNCSMCSSSSFILVPFLV